jgi:hypothetical protein
MFEGRKETGAWGVLVRRRKNVDEWFGHTRYIYQCIYSPVLVNVDLLKGLLDHVIQSLPQHVRHNVSGDFEQLSGFTISTL